MLRIVTGPFHPDLEQALVEDVRRLASDDRIAPAAIIVPSESLRRRLAWLLCIEERLALLDVPILTFHQFALSLLHEAHAPDAAGLRTDFFFREVVRQLLRAPEVELRWGNLADMPGAWAAVWSTLKDLKDAAVEPERVLDAIEALESDARLASATPGLQSSGDKLDLHGLADILDLYRQFRRRQDELLVWDRDDLAARAIAFVDASSFLQRRRQLLYYGFYDLTQVQLDLFRAVSHGYPTTVYFPLEAGDPAFEFAERFFTRYVCGLTSLPFEPARPRRKRTHERPCEQLAMPYESFTVTPAMRLISVAGALDEITLVAKDILGFVEERGMAFEDIGVTARSLAAYEGFLPRVFHEHGIPFTSTLGCSLAAFPYVKAVRQLLDIRSSGLRSQTVMALLDSPFLRLPRLCPPLRAGSITPRLDLWRLAVDRLGITGGAPGTAEDWQRLERFVSHGLPLREDLTREVNAEAPGPRVPGEQVELLSQAISTLLAVLNALPDSATWADYTARLRTICEELLEFTTDGEALTTVAGWSETFDEALEELTALSQLGETVSLRDFVEAFQRLVDEVRVPVGAAPGSQGGVQVMDAMAARGIPFRALYILGLNEKVFPRHIHEDAFLRDGARRFLEADLGFKIQEKLAGYQEEQLLFTLLCRSARVDSETGRPA
jgi:ATP-dependent helicase/nuclease subunit B